MTIARLNCGTSRITIPPSLHFFSPFQPILEYLSVYPFHPHFFHPGDAERIYFRIQVDSFHTYYGHSKPILKTALHRMNGFFSCGVDKLIMHWQFPDLENAEPFACYGTFFFLSFPSLVILSPPLRLPLVPLRNCLLLPFHPFLSFPSALLHHSWFSSFLPLLMVSLI